MGYSRGSKYGQEEVMGAAVGEASIEVLLLQNPSKKVRNMMLILPKSAGRETVLQESKDL